MALAVPAVGAAGLPASQAAVDRRPAHAARGYVGTVTGRCEGPGTPPACTVGAGLVPISTTWSAFVTAEPVRKVRMSWLPTTECTTTSPKGPWHVRWWTVPANANGGTSVRPAADGSIAGGTLLTDFGTVEPDRPITRTFSLGQAKDTVRGLVTYTGPNTQCATFRVEGLATDDVRISGHVRAHSTTIRGRRRQPGIPGVQVRVSGSHSTRATTDATGAYTEVVPPGRYSVKPSGADVRPVAQRVTVRHDVAGVDFEASALGHVTLGSATAGFDIETADLTGTAPGPTRPPSASVGKLVDDTSAQLSSDFSRGTVFPTATLVIFARGTRRPARTLTLTKASITSLLRGPGDQTEQLTLSAAGVRDTSRR